MATEIIPANTAEPVVTTTAAHTNARLKIGRREILASLVGILVFAALSYLTNFSSLQGAFSGQIRLAVAVPLVFGFIYGPIVGFSTGLFGNLIFDAMQGYVAFPPNPSTGNLVRDIFIGFILNWQIGNGISGLIPGLWALRHRRYANLRDMVPVLIISVIAVAAGIGFAALTDLLLYNGEGYEWFTLQYTIQEQFIPIFRHNVLNALVIVPLVLYSWNYLSQTTVSDLNIGKSGLLRRFAAVIVLSAAVPTLLFTFFLTQQSGNDYLTRIKAAVQESDYEAAQELLITQGTVDVNLASAITSQDADRIVQIIDDQIVDDTLALKLGFTILVTLVFTVINALILAGTISRPILNLAEAAKQMAAGKLSIDRARAIKSSEGEDEIAHLSRSFGTMSLEVIEREALLKRQVESLRIEVDMVKQSKQVSEITDTDFFRDLQDKAKSIRSRDRVSVAAALDSVAAEKAAPSADGDADSTHPAIDTIQLDDSEGANTGD
jgi:energy-coupling factor transport system substrate-specific component